MIHHPKTAPWALTGAVAFLGLFAQGCEDSSLGTVRAKMALSPEEGQTLTFDEAVFGRSVVDPKIVEVSSIGDATLELGEITVEGPAASSFRVSSRPRRLQPSQSGEIFVRFEPLEIGNLEADLVVRSNDPARAEARLKLAGPAREPCQLAVGPAHQSFLLGEIKTVSIKASSTHECSITRIYTDRSLFEIINEPETPFVIAAGTQMDLSVQHIQVSQQPGLPIRDLRVREAEGTEKVVSFQGEEPLYGCFTIDTNRLLYPTIPAGESRTRRVRVTNGCAKDAAVTSAVLTNGFDFFSMDSTGYPKIVAPRESLDIFVTYDRATDELGDHGLLSIGTNDARNPRFSVTLEGRAALPEMQAFPTALDFGTVIFKNPQGPELRSECGSRSQEVQIFSVGAANLVVTRLEMDPAGDQLFQVVSVTLDGQPVANFNQPITVAPDSALRVSLQFFPTTNDPPEHRGQLLIYNNVQPQPFSVQLVGRGADDGATSDTFEQPEGPKVDILWVIDDSCSMYDEQARLIQNLSQFVAHADTQNADYQMAVTVTDSGSDNAGKFRRCFPHPAIIGNNYADREAAFACTFEVGTRGSGIEAGLGAAMRALERATNPIEPQNNINAGFLRTDAKLAIVTLSDEEDQSEESDEVLRTFFFSVKGAHRPDRVKVHAIAGPVTEACQTGMTSAQPGFRYFGMTQQTDGIFFNICQEDWQPILQQLGLETFTPTDEWDLTQSADPSSIVVTVDGVVVPRDANSGWNYNPMGNSIHFNGASIPSPGAQIVVDYVGLCRP